MVTMKSSDITRNDYCFPKLADTKDLRVLAHCRIILYKLYWMVDTTSIDFRVKNKKEDS